MKARNQAEMGVVVVLVRKGAVKAVVR